MLLDNSSGSEKQFSLFSCQDDSRSAQLMKMVDTLNRIYGRNSVFFGSAGIKGKWAMKRDLVTPCYTTRWEEVPVVR